MDTETKILLQRLVVAVEGINQTLEILSNEGIVIINDHGITEN